jgi:hypothetical protein
VTRHSSEAESVAQLGMVKPISLRFEDTEVKRPRPAAYVVRAAACHVRAGLNLVGGRVCSPEAAVKELGYDLPTQLLLRSATSAADLTSSGWAQQLAGIAI